MRATRAQTRMAILSKPSKPQSKMALFRAAADANRVFTALSANVAASTLAEAVLPRYDASENLLWKFAFGFAGYTGTYMAAFDLATTLVPLYDFSPLYAFVVLGPYLIPASLQRLRDVSGAIAAELRGSLQRLLTPVEPVVVVPPAIEPARPYMSMSNCMASKCGDVYYEHWTAKYVGDEPPEGFFPNNQYSSIYQRQADYRRAEWFAVDVQFMREFPVKGSGTARHVWVYDTEPPAQTPPAPGPVVDPPPAACTMQTVEEQTCNEYGGETICVTSKRQMCV